MEESRERLAGESGEDYHWRQIALEDAGKLPRTDEGGYPVKTVTEDGEFGGYHA